MRRHAILLLILLVSGCANLKHSTQIDTKESYPTTTDTVPGDALFAKGRRLENEQDWTKAIDAYQEAIAAYEAQMQPKPRPDLPEGIHYEDPSFFPYGGEHYEKVRALNSYCGVQRAKAQLALQRAKEAQYRSEHPLQSQ